MFLCRLGSLNSFEQLKTSPRLCDLLGGAMPSADSLGRIFNLIDSDSIRSMIHHLYTSMKQRKILKPPSHGWIALVIDGHESHASYLRHCDECLERRKRSDNQTRVQYYHRNVTAQLVFNGFRFLLDAEAQLPGENELPPAMRLLDRVLRDYPRAFDVVVADAMYSNNIIFQKIIRRGKHVIAVLKGNRKHIFRVAKDALGDQPPATTFERKDTIVDCWELNKPWVPFKSPLRIVKTVERKPPIKRQLTGTEEAEPLSTWYWMTTVTADRMDVRTLVDIAHSRWSIENEGFNELSNHWHADHVYKHASVAILNFWLMSMVAYNLFRSFFNRNLKAVVRRGRSMLHFARMVAADLYSAYVPTGVPP